MRFIKHMLHIYKSYINCKRNTYAYIQFISFELTRNLLWSRVAAIEKTFTVMRPNNWWKLNLLQRRNYHKYPKNSASKSVRWITDQTHPIQSIRLNFPVIDSHDFDRDPITATITKPVRQVAGVCANRYSVQSNRSVITKQIRVKQHLSFCIYTILIIAV